MAQQKLSDEALKMMEGWEGLRLTAYPDIIGIWTIGYGHVDKTVVPGLTITPQEAEALFLSDVASCEACVRRAVTVPMTQGQFDALVSFSFNVGRGNFLKSATLRMFNAGRAQDAADALLGWVNAGGKAVPALARRRLAERQMFLATQV